MAQVLLTNQADLSGSYGALAVPVVFSSNSVTTTIIQGLTATKTVDKTHWVNGPLLYTIKIDNNSGDTFTKGVLTDIIDTSLATLDTVYGVEINGSKSSDYTFTAGSLSVNLPDVEDGGSATVTFQVVQN
ncbi:MAG: hypothetical protein ACLSUT_00920 [Christensenellales bacterium]